VLAMVSIAMIWFALLAPPVVAANPEPSCTELPARTSNSTFGVKAIETTRICPMSMFVTTADNEIRLRVHKRAKPMLVASFYNVGRIGAPLSWKGKTLVVHLPQGYKRKYLRVLQPRVGEVSLEFVNDYSEDQLLRDSGSKNLSPMIIGPVSPRSSPTTGNGSSR
jgi:hypothetical protein